ncbi:MAG: imidazoleglycerol-phosphate dehydratase HisB [Firmicutes bacterium]|nr:imidazoleglycerol-phosphate dehydratase HisB [Bacillota bacterium]
MRTLDMTSPTSTNGRTAIIDRKTAETDIKLILNIDGTGKSAINTGCGFLDHMLTLFARHGRFDLDVTCTGDTYVDYHHTAEDIGISLGKAFLEALGDKKGILRYGNFILPMDEALILSAVDISGRSYLAYGLEIPTEKVGDFDTELVEEFWLGFVRNADVTLHIRQMAGSNSHHIIEGAFKSVARSLKAAVAIDKDFADEIPSTKGVL